MASCTCRDLGIDCAFEAEADTEDELMEIIKLHLGEEHDITTIPPDIMRRIKKAFKEYHR